MFETNYIKNQTHVMACVFALGFPGMMFAGASSSTQDQVNKLAAQTEYTAVEAEAALETVKQIRQELVDDVLETQDNRTDTIPMSPEATTNQTAYP